MVYYNEIDPYAAAWLRELIAAGLIAPGVVDERSIKDVSPDDVVGFTQCHFFAGIGTWSYALRQAGWPDNRPVWTGSCPCQPFSVAGRRLGTSDDRHLWPEMYRLIRECRPDVVFGEQVAGRGGLAWLDLVAADLEDAGYAVGALCAPACGFGAPHIRQRLYWVADAGLGTLERGAGGVLAAQENLGGERQQDGDFANGYPDGREARPLADAEHAERRAEHPKDGETHWRSGPGWGGNAGILGDSESNNRWLSVRPEREQTIELGGSGPTNCSLSDAEGRGFEIRRNAPQPRPGRHADGDGILGDSDEQGCEGGLSRRQDSEREDKSGYAGCAGPTNGFWRNAEWIPCRDGNLRPTEPGAFPLVDGTAKRMVRSGDPGAPADEIDPQNTAEAWTMRLRGYGNAIVAPQAEAFIRAYMATTTSRARKSHKT